MRLLKGRELPDAVFFANDIMAIGGLDAIRSELKLRVPEDLSVIGFDDIEMSGWPSHSLTTVRQPVAEMIEKAVTLLDSSTAGKLPQARIHLIAGSLVERGSCKDHRG